MFLSIKGNSFSVGDRIVFLKGVGLGGWLNLEHFLLGIPGTETEIKTAFKDVWGAEKAALFWKTYREIFIGTKDIQLMSKLGFNCLRLPVNARLFTENDVSESTSFENSVAICELDRIISLCESVGIYCVIDLHSVWGGQNPDWHCDNNIGEPLFFNNEEFRAKTVLLWEKIAFHYKDNPWVGGYDLVNEPCYFDKSLDTVLLSFYESCIQSIRKVDTNHLIFLEGNTYARDFSMFSDNPDDKVAYSFHYYPFLQLEKKPQTGDLKELLKQSLYKDVTLTHLQNLGRPIWCGETGHPMHKIDHIKFLSVFIELLEEMNISWSLWPHKDARAMALWYLQKDSDYLQITKQASRNWNFWDFFTQDSILSVKDSPDKFAFYKQLAKQSTVASALFKEGLKSISFDSLIHSLDDFSIERCERNEQLLKVIN